MQILFANISQNIKEGADCTQGLEMACNITILKSLKERNWQVQDVKHAIPTCLEVSQTVLHRQAKTTLCDSNFAKFDVCRIFILLQMDLDTYSCPNVLQESTI